MLEFLFIVMLASTEPSFTSEINFVRQIEGKNFVVCTEKQEKSLKAIVESIKTASDREPAIQLFMDSLNLDPERYLFAQIESTDPHVVVANMLNSPLHGVVMAQDAEIACGVAKGNSTFVFIGARKSRGVGPKIRM